MPSRNRSRILLAVTLGIVVLFSSLVILEMSPVLALEREVTGPVKQAAPEQPPPPFNDDELIFSAYFTEDLEIQITDLSGNVIGEGTHQGQVKCYRDNCNQTTQLTLSPPLREGIVYEYKFTSRQVLDPEAQRVVVAGTGTIANQGQKERFSFIATFQNNQDGTVGVKYEASRPDASFIIPRSAGTFKISARR